MDRPFVTKCDHKHLRAHARGLCQTCYKLLRKTLEPDEFERQYPPTRKPQLTANRIADVYEDLAEIGVTRAEVARKLGITENAVELALKRKKKADEDKLVSNFIAEVEAIETLNRIDDMPSHGYWGKGDY